MLTVHGFPSMGAVASPSPFCLKLETWLRIAGIEYEAKPDFNPMQAPKGKAPYISLPDGGFMGDSSLIIDYLREREKITLDDDLDAVQRAHTVLIQRLVEDHLYFSLLFFRWVQEEGFQILAKAYFGRGSWFNRTIVPKLARRSVLKAANLQGVSRHSPEEVLKMAVQDFEALAAILGEKPYFLGEEPHSVDAIVYGTLANIEFGPFPGGMQDALREHENLLGYVGRMTERYWG